MRRIAITLLAGLLVSVGTNAPAASTTGMFPANLNDSWMLQRFGQEENQIRVTSYTRPGWLLFEGMFDMDLWLRASGAKVYVRTRATTPQRLLYDFEAEQGREWDVQLGDLVGFVTVAAKDATVDTAFGAKPGCTAFAFHWDNLADAGIEMQWFCPGLGLVKQDKSSIAGPLTEYTVASAIGGTIEIGYIGQGMNVRLDRFSAYAGEVLKARLELWDTTGVPNTTGTRRQFQSATTQLFELRIVNGRGETVRLWSSDKVFLPQVTAWTLEDEAEFDAELPLIDFDGRPLPSGMYTVEGWIIDMLSTPGFGARPAAQTQIIVY
jgi:hypothetical protein